MRNMIAEYGETAISIITGAMVISITGGLLLLLKPVVEMVFISLMA